MPSDKHLWVPTTDGVVDGYFDDDGAHTVSGAWHTIGRYLGSNKPNDLAPIKGKTVAYEVEDEEGKIVVVHVEILSDPKVIKEFDEAGEFDVIDETIYVDKLK